MVEGQRMTAAREAVEKRMQGEHADVLRESVAFMARELIEVEFAQVLGAEHGERAPERRSTQRNGYRYRDWDTRVGTLELAILKLCRGSSLPSNLKPRRSHRGPRNVGSRPVGHGHRVRLAPSW